ncbi:hypothetical protein JTE90_021216, partial [Oedothorax gibbosus]
AAFVSILRQSISFPYQSFSTTIFRVHRVPAKKSKPPDAITSESRGAICYEEGCTTRNSKAPPNSETTSSTNTTSYSKSSKTFYNGTRLHPMKKNVEEACD